MSLKRNLDEGEEIDAKRKIVDQDAKWVMKRQENKKTLEQALIRRNLLDPKDLNITINPNLIPKQKCTAFDTCQDPDLKVCVGCKKVVCEFHSGIDFLTDDPDYDGMHFKFIDFGGAPLCHECDMFIERNLYLFPESDGESDEEESEEEEVKRDENVYGACTHSSCSCSICCDCGFFTNECECKN